MAGALREQPKGQDPPRKAGTGANAVIRHRLFGAIPLRYGSVTVPLRSHYRSFTVPLQLHYGSLRPITPLLRLRAYTHRIRLIIVTEIQSKAIPALCMALRSRANRFC